MRALIVDDSRFVRAFLRGLLEERESSAKTRPTASPVWRPAKWPLLRPRPPGLNMPVMNGLEMLTQMRAQGFTDTKVLMVTTEAENDLHPPRPRSRPDEYLMKPF